MTPPGPRRAPSVNAIALAVVLLATAAIRWHRLDVPLERDEGEYAYAGQLILQGVPPYQLACNMKCPGTYAAYALLMALFGQTPAGIHAGLIIVTTVTSVLLYTLGRRLIDETAGVVAGATCAFLSASTSMCGLAAHATHFAALFATAGLCLLWPERDAIRAWRMVAAGSLFGLALLMKQQAAILGLWGAAVVAWPGMRRAAAAGTITLRSSALYLVGAILPFAATCLILWRAGVFASFWFWTITYARAYVGETPLSAAPRLLRVGISYVLESNALLWILAAGGLAIVWIDPRFRPVRVGLSGFLLASFLTTCPGFYFRTHYFLLMVPAASLLAGCSGSAASARFKTRAWPLVAYVLILAGSAFGNREAWCLLTPIQASRALYGVNPFPEAEVVSDYIRTHSSPGDRIAVVGSEPEIYFLSGRRSATSQIYTYALMEPQPFAHTMHEDMIRDIERAKPQYVVFAQVLASWLPRDRSDLTVITWWEGTYRKNYDLVGVAEIRSLSETRYSWGAEVGAPPGPNVAALLVYRRTTP